MARQPQVVAAVIRPCKSPVPKEAKLSPLGQHKLSYSKSKHSEAYQQQEARSKASSKSSTTGNFAKPTASTLLKSISHSHARSPRGPFNASRQIPSGLPKRREAKNSASSASAPAAMAKQRKPRLPASASAARVQSRPGTSGSSRSGGRRSSPTSSPARSRSKSSTVSSRARQTSSAGRTSGRTSAASARTHCSPATAAAPDRRRSSQSPRPSSHEARLDQVKHHIDHLRQSPPHLSSPDFTSTRTSLVERSRAPPPAEARRSGVAHPGNSTALFGSPRCSGHRSRSSSRSQSRCRSPSPVARGAPVSATRRIGSATWVETRNRAAPVAGARCGSGARRSPPPVWQTACHLPRVSYPRPSPATALRARSSSSQTRRAASSDRRVTLQRAETAKMDYIPQSRYMARLRKSGAGRPPSQHPSSQRPAASEPAQSPRRPARSTLRSATSPTSAAANSAHHHRDRHRVGDVLDWSAPAPALKKEVRTALRSRNASWSTTHGGASARGADHSRRPESGRQHQCVHEYYINSRLFPTPLYADSGGGSQCAACAAVARHSPAARRRSRSRSPGSERGRPRSRSPRLGKGARRTRSQSAGRRRSSVSWQDEQERSVSVTCPNCRHKLTLSATELGVALSDSAEPGRSRRRSPEKQARTRRPSLERPGRRRSPSLEEQSRRRPPSLERSAESQAGRRSPLTLRSRPVKAMFTVPTALFQDAREECGGPGCGPARRSANALWPPELDMSPSRVRPIARGWAAETGAGLGGRTAPPRRAADPIKNSYSLRQCMGQRL